MHHNAPVADIVAIRLHHDLPVGRHRTTCPQLQTNIRDDLTRGRVVNRVFPCQPVNHLRRVIFRIDMRPQTLRDLRPEPAVLDAQVRRPPRILATPKRHPRQRARRRLRYHTIIIYVNRAPDLTPQYEDVTNRRLVNELLI